MFIQSRIVILLILMNFIKNIETGNVMLYIAKSSFNIGKFVLKNRKKSALLGFFGYNHKETIDGLKKIDFEKLKQSESVLEFTKIAGEEVLKTGTNIVYNIGESFLKNTIIDNKEIIAGGVSGGLFARCIYNMQNGYNKAQQNQSKYNELIISMGRTQAQKNQFNSNKPIQEILNKKKNNKNQISGRSLRFLKILK